MESLGTAACTGGQGSAQLEILSLTGRLGGGGGGRLVGSWIDIGCLYVV